MELLHLSVIQWAALVLCALLVGLTKAGFGAGLSMVATPLMTIALDDPRLMLPLMNVVLVCGDLFSVVHYPKKIAWRNIAILVPGCLIGVGLGWVLLALLGNPSSFTVGGMDGNTILKRLVGGICILFVGIQLWRQWRESRSSEDLKPYRPKLWHGVSLGTAAGTTSTIAHAAGPLIALFLLPQKLDKAVFVGTSVTYFFIGNLVKFIPFTAQGLFTGAIVGTSLLLVPAVVVGTLLGVFLNRRISATAFVPVVYVFTTLMGLDLLFGLSALLPGVRS